MGLFCYVVDHDTGLAPNPNNRVCTLVYCKYKKPKGKRKNVVELAKEEDWIVGVGGKSKRSCGQRKIVYIMRVDKKLSFSEYRQRFPRRLHRRCHGEYALISHTFLYFGREAIAVEKVPGADKVQLGKTGRGFRSKFSEEFIGQLARWVHRQPRLGKIGEPCSPDSDCVPRNLCRCRE